MDVLVPTVYDFEERPSSDYFCPVTSELLKDPRQTNFCCGHHLSHSVAVQLEAEGKPCPLCKKGPLKTTEDLFFKRKVMQLTVRCSNKPLGCPWVGTVESLDQHLGYGCTDGECSFVTTECPFKCSSRVQRCKLEEHKTNECVKRPIICNHCQYKGTYEVVVHDHLPVCEKYPVNCPKMCSETKFERCLLASHLEQCPLREVECEYHYAGCKAKIEARNLKEHMQTAVEEHLHLVAGYSQALHTKVDALQLQFQKFLKRDLRTVCVPVPQFSMSGFHHKKKRNCIWYSPPFYTHSNGYKLCLRVYANGNGRCEGTHLSVFLNIMAGEFDALLRWPFRGELKVQLLNQKDEEYAQYYQRVIKQLNLSIQDKAFHRVTRGDRADRAWGFANFIVHENLYNPRDGKEFLKNDTLTFRVTGYKAAV